VRRFLPTISVFFCAAFQASGASIGSGSATPAIQQSFVNGYNRNAFALKVVLPPLNDVHGLGSPGLIQEFGPAASQTGKFALIKPDPNAPVAQFDVLQMYSDVYAFYTTVGVSSAGYPTIDTTVCPVNTVSPCNYQLFSKNYALFVYSNTGNNVSVRDPFYTAWTNLGGISGSAGLPAGAESTVTSPSKVQATQQAFENATIFSYPVSSTTPTVHSVVEPFNSAFNGAGGITVLGLPTSEVFAVGVTGTTRQTFEYGRIEMPLGGVPKVLLNLTEVDINGVSLGLSLSVGGTAVITAATFDLQGSQVTDRVLTWNSTNGSVVKVTGNGYSAMVQALSGGSANVYVTVEGKTSVPLVVRVGSVCCAVGEGAPTSAITQAFQDAVSRNNLAVSVPAAAPVTRQGSGYVQALSASDGSGTSFVIAQGDGQSKAYVVTGSIYAAYLSGGGFTGALGYPVSDLLPGGAQKFSSGAALAGSPVRVVPGVVAAKWFLLGGPAGAAGLPVADSSVFTSFSGIGGIAQAFASGMIFGITSGASSGQAWFSSGLILARYLALSGPLGALGVPVGDITGVAGSVQQENFETGLIDLQPGAGAAVEHFNPRHPAISAIPAVVVPGGKVHISATGFAPGSALSFTISGQPGFSLQSAAGAYSWDVIVPASAKPATVALQVSAKPGTDLAAASYSISSVPALLPKLTIVSGDRQTGAPGAALPLPVTAVLLDSGGAPIAGVAVGATVSPGATLQSSSITDSNGRVSATVRLPASSGVSVGSFSAGGQVAEFSALAAAMSIVGFPAFTQTDGQGGLVAALASLVRFYQNSGALPVANGSASPALLNQYLAANNGFWAADSGAMVANPWVAARFASAGVFSEPANPGRIADLIAQGTPVAVVLNLTVDGAAGGSAAVSAIGVNADSSVSIFDPNPAYARASLSDYLAGFSAQGHSIRGAIGSVLRVGTPQLPAGASPFVVASALSAASSAASPRGSCPSVDVFEASAPSGVRFQYCDGTQPAYEVDLAASKAGSIVDLSGAGGGTSLPGGTASWQISRAGGAIAVAPQTLTISSVTDSAAFASTLAPGGLITIFGTGFNNASTVSIGDASAQIVAAFPFQINALIPAAAIPGNASLRVTTATASANKPITISPLAPGIFVIGANSQGAIVNLPDGTINSSTVPAQRGQFISVYAAGLGATALRNGFQTANTAISVVINSVAAASSFAGLIPGFVGLYQVNVLVPASLPPSLAGSLALQQGAQMSNVVSFAVQ
jgi:uncharacterized protein (TIGR03437 family)